MLIACEKLVVLFVDGNLDFLDSAAEAAACWASLCFFANISNCSAVKSSRTVNSVADALVESLLLCVMSEFWASCLANFD